MSEFGRFVLSNFPGLDERTDCEESECKVVPGESKAQLHSFFTSAWGADEWSSAHNTRRVGWVNPRAGLDVLGNGKVGNRVFCVNRRNVEKLEAAFSHLKAKCHAAN